MLANETQLMANKSDRPDGDGLRRAISQFEALRNAYRGYLPWGSDNTDVKTRQLQIEDMDKAFFAAIRSISTPPTRDGAEGAGERVARPYHALMDMDMHDRMNAATSKPAPDWPQDAPPLPHPELLGSDGMGTVSEADLMQALDAAQPAPDAKLTLAAKLREIRRDLGGFDYATVEDHIAERLLAAGYSSAPVPPANDGLVFPEESFRRDPPHPERGWNP